MKPANEITDAPTDPAKCQKCQKEPATEQHICPFKEEVYDDNETRCNCCKECERDCFDQS